MVSVLREAAPSAFGSLLRRSKFASFDRKIAQIYTTFDGHAHRGNWGLKRPLAMRKKNGGFIIVKSVDSNEQQTEWYRAEQEARWLKAASELGKDVDIREDSGLWSEYMGGAWQKTYDSDYNLDPSQSSEFGPNIIEHSKSDGWLTTDRNRIRSAHALNPSAMNPRQFRRYLAKIRSSRHRFTPLVQADIAKMNTRRPGQYNAFNVVHLRSQLLPTFLTQETNHDIQDYSARILPNPHHNAGLSYSHTSDLTNKVLHPPVPGRTFNPAADKKTDLFMTAGVAGLLGRIIKNDALGGRKPPKLADANSHSQPILFRAKTILLHNPPRVVGAPSDSTGFKDGHVQFEFVEDAVVRSKMSNPFPPGSQSYVAHYDPQGSARSGGAAMASRSQQKKTRPRLPKGTNGNSQRRNSGAINDMLQSIRYNRGLDLE